jgi:hypothetical protein
LAAILRLRPAKLITNAFLKMKSAPDGCDAIGKADALSKAAAAIDHRARRECRDGGHNLIAE